MSARTPFRKVFVAAVAVTIVGLVVVALGLVFSAAGPANAETAAAEPEAGEGRGGEGQPAEAVRLVDPQGVLEERSWTDTHGDVAASLVAKLEQQAFYAEDRSFLDTLVVASSRRSVAAELAGRVESTRWRIADAGGPAWFVSAPLAVETTEVSDEQVVLNVWVTGVLATNDVAYPEARYWMEAAEFGWVDNRWQLVDLSPVAGAPQPMLPLEVEPSQRGDLFVALDGFRLVGSGQQRQEP